MKTCHCCTAQLEDDALYCRNCGAPQTGEDKAIVRPVSMPAPEPEIDLYDHTAEYEAADVAQNKLWAMLVYLLDAAGVLLALLGAKNSAYVMFHVRQSLKFTVLQVILAAAAAVLFWTFLVPIAAGVALAVLTVLRAIAFIQVCRGEAREPAIIRSLGFLK